jgi:glycosyltransferase involved in cell wall biosynthesis
MPISVIIPVFNDAAMLEESLQALQPLRSRGNEVLAVDGGSRDGSVTIARKYVDRVLMSGTGRALQMNTGCEFASHEIFLFLQVDTRLPDNADVLIEQAVKIQGAQWGYFEMRAAKGGWLSRFAAAKTNWRAEVKGIAAGEQAIFVTRNTFERAKGFDMVPAGEGQAFSAKLLKLAKPVCVKSPVTYLQRKP